MSPAATLYIVEKLTTKTWLLAVWPRLRRRADHSVAVSPGTVVYYIDATRLAARIASLMCRRLRIRAERLRFEAADIFDDDGLLIWLKSYYQDLQGALSCILQEGDFPGEPNGDSSTCNRRMYLRKQCAPGTPLFAGSGIWRSVFLMRLAWWHAKRAMPEAPSVELWLENHPWFAALQRYAGEIGRIELIPCGRAYRPSPLIRQMLAKDAGILVDRWVRRRKKERGVADAIQPVSSCPTIALQYYGHFNLTAPELHSDFFFWQQSELEGRHLVALFAFPRDPLDSERLAELSKQGIRGLALRPSATTLRTAAFAETGLLRNLCRAASVVASFRAAPRQAWRAAYDQVFQAEVEYWTRLLKTARARVYLTWFKYNADHCPIAEALRLTDGVLAIYQRSYEGNPSAQTTVACDLAFGFSRHGATIEQQSGSQIDYYVITGYLGDHRFALVKPAADRIRQTLLASGAQFIIAYFDESSFPDGRWDPALNRTRSHYRSILERVLTDSQLGLVLKPKTPATLRTRLGPVASLLEQAIQTGRCHILEEGLLQGSVPPAQAALAADVAIHESIASGTAAIEAALAGVPTLIIDDDGWTISPLYRLGLGSVIFRNWRDLWSTLDSVRDQHFPTGLGDWAPLLDELDPFRDGRAAERMGTFLKWLIESYDGGASRDAALAQAAERYAGMWGADKVMRIAPATC